MIAQLGSNRAVLQVEAVLLQDPCSQPLFYIAIGLYDL